MWEMGNGSHLRKWGMKERTVRQEGGLSTYRDEKSPKENVPEPYLSPSNYCVSEDWPHPQQSP